MLLAPEQDSQQSWRPNHPKPRRTHFSQNLGVTGLSFVPPFICLSPSGCEFDVASLPNDVKPFSCRWINLDLPRSRICVDLPYRKRLLLPSYQASLSAN